MERIKTGIIGLDELIEGGFEKNSLNEIAGSFGIDIYSYKYL